VTRERSQPIDLLPDRSVETVAAWLQKHPSLEVVSRDGSWEYAVASKKVVPQARQVSDRWHLVKNLAACVSVQLAQSLARLRRAETAAAGRNEQVEEHPSNRPRPAQTRAIAQAQVARQAERTARYEHIVQLQKQGLTSAEIALQLGVTPRTIQRWIATGTIPSSRPRRQRARLLDASHSYIVERCKQGCRNGAQLERELRAKGYQGSGRALYR
jgi:excisionase family DNA binding protein